MELKLVYRALRKISDWALDGFYSEVYVDGAENVPERAPLIIASSHHNEIIDIATLAATIPFRRHVSFWAKSSMFRNPLAGQILYSSGAIPVYRNPNSSPIQATSASSSKNTRQPTSLFDTSSRALKRGEVLGVFPEGTSYTEPQIVQIKDGAAWAAVEYAKYVHARQPGSACGLVIVPVGIVYTDKSQYQSRVRVRYGRPIAIDAYASEFLGVGEDDADARARATVRKLTNAIETSLFELTINAPDWDILYASRMARDILWRDPERINLKYWVPVNQRLIGIMDKTSGRERCQPALLRYYSLLHYTGLAHADLSAVLSSRAGESYRPSVGRALAKFVANFLRMTLHPGAILFAPMLVLHVPAYLLGLAAARMFAPPGEEEAPAQWKTVFGGLGMALVYVPASLWTATAFLRTLRSGINSSFFKGFMSIFCNSARVEEAAYRMASFVYGTGGFSVKARLHEAVGWLGVAYVHGLVLARWHNALVGGNYRRFKRLVAAYKVLVGSLSRPLSEDKLQAFLVPPLPPVNPYIKRKPPTGNGSLTGMSTPSSQEMSRSQSSEDELNHRRAHGKSKPSVGPLMEHLLAARSQALTELAAYIAGLDSSDVEWLRARGAETTSLWSP